MDTVRMPVLFVGHGSPMNVLEDNEITRGWTKIAQQLPRPKAILCVSAHWFTRGWYVSTVETPKTIHDFYGFPKELYDLTYPAPGAPQLAQRAIQLVGPKLVPSDEWGLDHGAWSVLRFLFPQADIPVCQLSVNALATPQENFELGQALAPLRDEGVMIIGSGDVVHNLRLVDWANEGGFDWAYTFDEFIQKNIEEGNFDAVQNYTQAGESAKLSVPTRDHFDPLLYALGAANLQDAVQVFNKICVLGSLSMTSYSFLSGSNAPLA